MVDNISVTEGRLREGDGRGSAVVGGDRRRRRGPHRPLDADALDPR
ncbi:hypothetical protein ACOJIV_24345 [Haloarcula sp. AONF1]